MISSHIAIVLLLLTPLLTNVAALEDDDQPAVANILPQGDTWGIRNRHKMNTINRYENDRLNYMKLHSGQTKDTGFLPGNTDYEAKNLNEIEGIGKLNRHSTSRPNFRKVKLNHEDRHHLPLSGTKQHSNQVHGHGESGESNIYEVLQDIPEDTYDTLEHGHNQGKGKDNVRIRHPSRVSTTGIETKYGNQLPPRASRGSTNSNVRKLFILKDDTPPPNNIQENERNSAWTRNSLSKVYQEKENIRQLRKHLSESDANSHKQEKHKTFSLGAPEQIEEEKPNRLYADPAESETAHKNQENIAGDSTEDTYEIPIQHRGENGMLQKSETAHKTQEKIAGDSTEETYEIPTEYKGENGVLQNQHVNYGDNNHESTYTESENDNYLVPLQIKSPMTPKEHNKPNSHVLNYDTVPYEPSETRLHKTRSGSGSLSGHKIEHEIPSVNPVDNHYQPVASKRVKKKLTPSREDRLKKIELYNSIENPMYGQVDNSKEYSSGKSMQTSSSEVKPELMRLWQNSMNPASRRNGFISKADMDRLSSEKIGPYRKSKDVSINQKSSESDSGFGSMGYEPPNSSPQFARKGPSLPPRNSKGSSGSDSVFDSMGYESPNSSPQFARKGSSLLPKNSKSSSGSDSGFDSMGYESPNSSPQFARKGSSLRSKNSGSVGSDSSEVEIIHSSGPSYSFVAEPVARAERYEAASASRKITNAELSKPQTYAFISKSTKEGRFAVGVADGLEDSNRIKRRPKESNVATWSMYNDYAKAICYFGEHRGTSGSAKELLKTAESFVLGHREKPLGCATVCFAVFDPSGTVSVANLGDTGATLYRRGEAIKTTNMQFHKSKQPFMMSKSVGSRKVRGKEIPYESVTAQSAEESIWELKQGDYILLSTKNVRKYLDDLSFSRYLIEHNSEDIQIIADGYIDLVVDTIKKKHKKKFSTWLRDRFRSPAEPMDVSIVIVRAH